MENLGVLLLGILFYGYIIGYVGLGIFQVFQGLYYLIFYRGDDAKFKRQIRYYVGVVVAYLFIAFALRSANGGIITVVYLMILPVFIAIWHTRIIRDHRKASTDTEVLDSGL